MLFQKWTICFLIVILSIFTGLIVNSPPVFGAACGNGIKECACGDTVENDRTLHPNVDPIVERHALCVGDGLIMNTPGVVVNLGGNKIQGSGIGVGILITVDNVIIKNGRVDGFETGIGTGSEVGTAGTTSGSTIDAIRPNLNTSHGILLKGDNNDLTGILAKRSGINGVTVIGNNNRLQDHNDEYNRFHGLFVQGDFNQIIDNRASENAKSRTSGDGIHVEGNNNLIAGSDVTKLNINGIVLLGNDNILDANGVTRQKGDGIIVDGDRNVLTDNLSTANRGVGIRSIGVGNPNASTGNHVSENQKSPQCSIYGRTTSPTCIQP